MFSHRKTAAQWQRKVFNGLAQVIVAAKAQEGEITLKSTSEGLESDILKISVSE